VIILLTLSKKKILVLLAERGMTTAGLARRAGVAASNMSQLLNRGTCMPKTAGRIAAALNCRVQDVIEDT